MSGRTVHGPNRSPADSVVCFVNTYIGQRFIRLTLNNWGQETTEDVKFRGKNKQDGCHGKYP